MKITIVLLYLILSVACKSQSKNLLEIDPKSFKENSITLSDIADDISYIQLDNKIPIGIVYKLKITDFNIYLSVKDIGILKYDRHGKLVSKIGTTGRGPGEYQHFMDFTVDQTTGNVYVMGPKEIKVYSQSGRFIRDIKYDEYIPFVGGDIEIYNSKIFIPDYLITGNSKNAWIFLDTLGKLYSRKYNSIPPFKTNTGIEGSIYKIENQLYYYNLYNDTIFSIAPDMKSKPAYLFAKGKHRWPIGMVKTDSESWRKIFKPVKMFETRHFIVLLYSYMDISGISLIDKQTRQVFVARTRENTYSEPYLMNDLDGGLPFGFDINYHTEIKSEYLVQLINPSDLIIHVNTSEFKSKSHKYPEKKRALENFASTLKDTDNPILMMSEIKK